MKVNEYISTLIQTAHNESNQYSYALTIVNNRIFKCRYYHPPVKIKNPRLQKSKTMLQKIKLTKEEEEKIKNISINRSIKSVYDYILANFTTNNYFYTLTYDQKKYPESLKTSFYSQCCKHWKTFKDLFFDYHFAYKTNAKYLAILEYNAKTPHWHIHFLCSFRPNTKSDYESYIQGCKKVQEIWGKGIIRVQRIKSFKYWKRSNITPSPSALASYMSKYITKSIKLGAYPKNKKRFFKSNNLIKPQKLYTDLNPFELRLAHLDGYNPEHNYNVSEHKSQYFNTLIDYNLKKST